MAEVFGVTVSDDVSDCDDEVHSEPEPDDQVTCFRLRDFTCLPRDTSYPNVSCSGNTAEAFAVQAFHNDHLKQDLSNRLLRVKKNPMIKHQVLTSTATKPRFDEKYTEASFQMPPSNCCRDPTVPHVEAYHALASERPCHAILDTGGSRCIIGENVWKRLLEHLSKDVRDQSQKKPSNVKFRFGNNQFLTSHFRVQIPSKAHFEEPKRLWSSLGVVPGSTPFLFSKRAFKQLGGVLNTVDDSCFLRRLNRYVDVSVSKTDLYLIGLTQLCEDQPSHSASFDVAVRDSLVTESRGNDSSNGKHERVSQCFSHAFLNRSKEILYSKPVHVSNCDSKSSIDRDSNPASSLPSNKHAEPNDGDLERCGRIHGRTDDHVTANSDFTVGSFEQFRDAGRIQRGQSGDEANVGEYGPRTSKHSAGTDGKSTGQPESSASSNSWTSKWKQSGHCSWRNRCQSWTRDKTSVSSSQPTGLPVSPTGTMTNSTWILAEEDEQINVMNVPTSTAPTPGTTASRPLSIAEMGQKIIFVSSNSEDRQGAQHSQSCIQEVQTRQVKPANGY